MDQELIWKRISSHIEPDIPGGRRHVVPVFRAEIPEGYLIMIGNPIDEAVVTNVVFVPKDKSNP
jgi:hypothetical protein